MKEKLYKVIRHIIRFLIFVYCKIIYRVKIIGIENIPKKGAIIFCGNHRNLLDAPLIEVTCNRDDTRFLAKEELGKNKYLAHLGKVFNVIFVKRNSKDLGSMKESIKTLKNGGAIAVFPEGTRNGLKKGIKPKTGVAYFAINSDAQVIPVGIKGGKKIFEKAIITYGKPINLEEYKTKKLEKETAELVTAKIMDNILKLAK